MNGLVIVLLDVLIGGVVLWLAAKLTSVDLSLSETVIASLGAAIVSLVPSVGWLLSVVTLLVLLKKFSRANLWPDIILLVMVSRLLAFAVLVALGG